MADHSEDFGTLASIGRAMEGVARAIHDEGGGCCEVGYDACPTKWEARRAATVGLAAWFSWGLRWDAKRAAADSGSSAGGEQ